MASFVSRLLPQSTWALTLVLVVSACGTPPSAPLRTTQPHSPQALEVFTTGYSGITEKYINPVELKTIALEGIKGFAAIDPALVITHDADSISLNLSNQEIARRALPGPTDTRGWAALTVDLASEARAHSNEMHKASAEKLYEAVFDGALSELDVFSRYAGAEEARRNRSNRDGFGGIGIRFKFKASAARITQVMPGTPAQLSGLKVGDRITHINGEKVGKTSRDISLKLRGPANADVQVTVFRASEERSLKVQMTRQHIVPPTVTARLENDVLYLRISNFNQGTASAVAEELENGKANTANGLEGIIIDLRGNPGGLLKQSIKVADLMLTHGHILSTRGRHPDSLHHYEAGGRDLADGLPMVVIIDGKSASASEIVAAALQDRDRAVVIGTSSFGKGSVQTVLRLPNDGEITLTWSRFLAPSGYALHGLGVLPAVCTSQVKKGFHPTIEKALAERSRIRATFSSWRAAGIQNEARRKALRNTCPPERRKAYTDIRIAKFLATDRSMYSQALDISATTAQAHK
jgi:carboxyl-terminal processing protease